MIASFLSFLIRLILLAACTFLFVVLFEHGPQNYIASVQKDFARLTEVLAAATAPIGQKLPTAGLDEPAGGR